jgi:hypothetical protein
VAAREKVIRVIEKLHSFRLTKAAELVETVVGETLAYYNSPEGRREANAVLLPRTHPSARLQSVLILSCRAYKY